VHEEHLTETSKDWNGDISSATDFPAALQALNVMDARAIETPFSISGW